MRKDIYLSVIAFVAGELMMPIGQFNIGLAIHIINLQAIALTLIYGNNHIDNKNILQSLILLLLMRIINLSMPQVFTITLLSYPLVYGILFLPVYSLIKAQGISYKEIGINFTKLNLYIPAAFLIGTAMATIEYRILRPAAMIENTRFTNLVLIITVMFVFVAAVEELIFRSILLTRFEKVFGDYKGLYLSSILFGIMHAIYGPVTEIMFATFFGAVLGFAFQKTRSFPFVLLIHGTANVFLFGILPMLSP